MTTNQKVGRSSRSGSANIFKGFSLYRLGFIHPILSAEIRNIPSVIENSCLNPAKVKF